MCNVQFEGNMDNATVIEGASGRRYFADPHTGIYGGHDEPIDIAAASGPAQRDGMSVPSRGSGS